MNLIDYMKEFTILFHVFLILSFVSNISSRKEDRKLLEPLMMPTNARVRFFLTIKMIWNKWFYILFLIPCILTSFYLHWLFGIFLFIEAYIFSRLIHRILFGILDRLDKINNIYSRKMEFFLCDFRLYLILGDIYLIVEIIKIINNAS